MGRKRSVSESSGHDYGNSEEYANSSLSNSESPSRKRVKRKHKKSHKYIMLESELNENEYYRKHKHKHKKHKREYVKHREEYYDSHESSKHIKRKHNHRSSRHKKHSDSDRSRHSSHSRKSKHRHSKEVSSEELKHEPQEQKSRWADEEDHQTNHVQPIKTEPISDDDAVLSETNNSENHKNNNDNDNKNQKDDREKWGKNIPLKVKEEKVESKEKVNMGLSGKLTEDTNTYNGIVIKYSQPPEARKPKRRWRWYIFKGEEEIPFLPLHRQSAYLIGRERKVADIPTDHPSCSKQHAVFQYRLVSYERSDGSVGRTVKPYILDLESANGTYVNNHRIEPRCYVELFEKDVVKFGYSSREYVLLHEASKGSDDELADAGATDGTTDMSPISLLRSQ